MLGLPPMAYSLETSGELPLIDTSLESKMPQEFGLKGSTARFVAVWSRASS
jgi:shikimate kinase